MSKHSPNGEEGKAATWTLALLLWVCFGLTAWAQIQTTSAGISGLSSDGTSITSTQVFLGPNGTAALPTYAYASEPSLGIYRAASGQIGFSITGANRYRMAGTQMDIGSGVAFGWSNNAAPVSGTMDLDFARGGAPGSLRVKDGTSPTSTNCGGAGLTITGNNSNGSVVLGAAPPLPCAIVFNGTWTSAPHCYLNPEVLTTGTTTVRATTPTTTGFVITSTAALVATDKVTWWCVGE